MEDVIEANSLDNLAKVRKPLKLKNTIEIQNPEESSSVSGKSYSNAETYEQSHMMPKLDI